MLVPKDIFFGSVWALSVGVCEMWTTWMCLPVAVPAHPRILAGRRFLRISPHISPDRGGAETGRSDFIYTKNSAIGRSDCIYTKNSARPRWDFLYRKNFIRKIMKIWWYIWKFSALRARQFVKNFWGKIMTINDIFEIFRAVRASL